MLCRLKFAGFILLNLIVAVIGTAVLDTPVRRMLPSHSIAAVIWKEVVLSIICAGLIGFGMWRIWPNSSAKWTWVLPAISFAAGYLAVVGRGDVFGRLSDFGSGTSLSAADVRGFFAFTVPLIRAASYSAGAYLAALPRAHHAHVSDSC
jgi:hypothetical protein